MEPLNSILPAQTCPDMANRSGSICTVEQLSQEALPETADFSRTLEEKMLPLEGSLSSISGISDTENISCPFAEETSEETDMPLPEQTPAMAEKGVTEGTETTEKTVLPQVPQQAKTLLVNAYGAPAASKREIPSEEIRMINETVAALEGSPPRPKTAKPEPDLEETPTSSADPETKEPDSSEQALLTPYGAVNSAEIPLKGNSSSDKGNMVKTLSLSGEKGTEQQQPLSLGKETDEEPLPEKELPFAERKQSREGPVTGKTQDSREGLFKTGEKDTPVKTSVSELSAGPMDNLQGKGSPAGTAMDSVTLQTSGERAIGEGIAHVVSFLKNEKGEKKGILRVEPPELGKVRIVVNSSSDEVHVHLTVERPEAGDLVKGSEDVLRDALKRQGLTLGDLSVDIGNSGGREQFTGQEEHSFHTYPVAETDLTETDDDTPAIAEIDLNQGLLHWIA